MGPESASTPVAVLAVGGIDPTGGAGLTVDIGFLTHLGARVGTVVTALTVQDDDAVTRVEPVADDLFEQQLDAAARTLSPLVGAVKTGLIAGRRQAEAVARLARRRGWPLVVDPLLVAGTGESFLGESGPRTLAPLVEGAAVVTPNLHEAELLSGMAWDRTESGLLAMATAIGGGRRIVAVSGGHAGGDTVPLAIAGPGVARVVHALRRRGVSTHGTGCALAASTAGLIALGRPPAEAVCEAHELVARAIREAPEVPGRRLSPSPPTGPRGASGA